MTLHNTVEILKGGFKWIIAGIAGIIVIIMLLRVGQGVKNTLFPPAPQLPSVDFGKLPGIQFGQSAINHNFTYTVDTLSGTLPTFPDRTKVYKTYYAPLTLLNTDKAMKKMQTIGFTDGSGQVLQPTLISPVVYQWEKEFHVGKKTLTMNIETYDFTIKTNYLSNVSFPTVAYDERQADSTIINALRSISLFYSDIDEQKVRTQLLSIKDGILIPASSLSKAQLIAVDLYQKNIDDISIFYPRYPQSTMHFLLAGRNTSFDDVIDGDFKHITVDTNSSGVYPIKTSQEAFEELKAGKGFIANYYGSGSAISITDVYLGYFAGGDKQEYLMPIIVFEGEGQFFGFVSAVKEEWLER